MDDITRGPALEAALFMAEMGARVFPIAPGRKTPIFSKWPERATTDLGHHSRLGRAQPGMQLGHGVRDDPDARCR
jgi:Bifunctional DNA primase/polymerase, N-terminal